MKKTSSISNLADHRREGRKHTSRLAVSATAGVASAPLEGQRFPVWSDEVRSYLRQQIASAANAEERADAVRLAQKLARG